jgi:hypothetical protein
LSSGPAIGGRATLRFLAKCGNYIAAVAFTGRDEKLKWNTTIQHCRALTLVN